MVVPKQSGEHFGNRVAELARTFPDLRAADGVRPWHEARFVAWVCGPEPTCQAMHAARLVLRVWKPEVDWIERYGAASLEPFDAVRACRAWDDAHANAFRRWLRRQQLQP